MLRKYKRQDTPTLEEFSKRLPAPKPSSGLIFEEEEEEENDDEEEEEKEESEDDKDGHDNDESEDIENETVTKVYEEVRGY